MTPFGLAVSAVGIVLALVANACMYRLLNELNTALPREERIGPFLLQPKMGAIFARHRQLFPNSHRRRQVLVLGICAVFLVLLGSCVG
jgi:hypothetical protein